MDLTQEPAAGIIRPASDPAGYAARAASSLRLHGWAVVKGALGEEEVDRLLDASRRSMQELLDRDEARMGNRGPRRYSLGSASKTHHMVHLPEWAGLIDNPVITPILRHIFQDSYVAIGGGGDVVLGLTDSVQWLHVDLPRWEMYDRVQPPPGIGVNWAVQDISCQGGPMRLVPDTHTLHFQLDKMNPANETALLEREGLSRVFVCPLQRGDVVLRDLRTWHAGSANLATADRHFPNTEFLATWYADLTEGTDDHLAPRKAIPHGIWSGLSPYAQSITKRAVADDTISTGFNRDIKYPQQYD